MPLRLLCPDSASKILATTMAARINNGLDIQSYLDQYIAPSTSHGPTRPESGDFDLELATVRPFRPDGGDTATSSVEHSQYVTEIHVHTESFEIDKKLSSVELAIPLQAVTSSTTSPVFEAEIETNIINADISSIIEGQHASSLAPVDGGSAAWSFVGFVLSVRIHDTNPLQLLSAFLVETIVWGFPNAFGSFLDAYLKDTTYSTQKHANLLLPLIGTLSSGIIYCSGSSILIQ